MDDKPRVLLVDDEVTVLRTLTELVELEGFTPISTNSGGEALGIVRKERVDIVLLDIRMPGMDGFEVLARIREADPDLPVVMISGTGGVRDAVETMRLGAEDFVTKPFRSEEVFRALHRALRVGQTRRELRMLTSRWKRAGRLQEFMGPSDQVARLNEDVARVGPTKLSVVIQGETGTGKELVARAIHLAGGGEDPGFVPVDCGAIPETLFESELFGHEKGAFTGADRRRKGKFELAADGTLLLDEVANMPASCQAKVLRALQESSITRVGGAEPIATRCRIIAASNRNLKIEAEKGRFREDLFYRLNDYTIVIPPLRDRQPDILFLAKAFLDTTNEELRKHVRGFSEDAVERLLAHPWPGNVRELQSAIRRATLLAEEFIESRHLSLSVKSASSPPPLAAADLDQATGLKEQVRRRVDDFERSAILAALEAAGGNKAEAARRLRIDYKTLYVKAKRLGI